MIFINHIEKDLYFSQGDFNFFKNLDLHETVNNSDYLYKSSSFGGGTTTTTTTTAAPYYSSIKYYNGSSYLFKPVKMWNGSSWVNTNTKRWNGSNWVSINQILSLVTGYNVLLDFGNSYSYSGTGTTVLNLGSATANGTIYNGTYSSSGGGSLSFNGSSSYIDCGSNTSIADFTGFTSSIWFNVPNITTAGNLIYKSDNNSSAGYWIDLRPTYQELGFQIVNSSTNSRKYIDRTVLTGNTWYNLVCVWSGGTSNTSTSIYLNNVLQTSYATNSSGTGTRGSDAAQPLQIGNSRTGSAAFFNGLISNVLIYNRVLTANELTQNYTYFKNRFGY